MESLYGKMNGGKALYKIEVVGEFERKTMLSTTGMVSSGSSKRPRPHGCQIASCLVDGCVSDLGKCREYHRRHKVCEAHSKTAIVMVGGREQRFCQQCSRFHLLVEFDEAKRSCRKRLDGHNRRRRKPQPNTLNPGTFTNHQGNIFTSYGRVLPAAAPTSDRSMFISETKDIPLLYGPHFPLSSRGSFEASAVASSTSGNNAFDSSDCALSLLSSSVGQPLVTDAHYARLGQYSTISCSGMGGDGTDGNSETLPFTWQ